MKHSISYEILPDQAFITVNKNINKNKEKLQQYIDLLFWWNKKINLFSRDVSRETIMEHIRHSLLLCSIDVLSKYELVVDAGTGGGLPGVPLAIADPDINFMLNDIVTKKIMAVKQMGRKLSLNNVSLSNESIEDIRADKDILLISKHAFKVNDLYRLAAHLPWSSMVLYKSINFENELSDIDVSLDITVLKLYPNNKQSFYKNKGILIIKR